MTHPDTEATRAGEIGHGSIRLIDDKCTSCMICVRECPTWCIHLASHTEGRHNVLDGFDIDWALCMYCGICIEECPFDALEWAGAHVEGADSREGLVHDRDALGAPSSLASRSATPAAQLRNCGAAGA